MQCGCQDMVVTSHCDRHVRQQTWTEDLSLQGLEKDLGPSVETWFDNLTRERVLKPSDPVPAVRQAGWSPCPAGGVVNISASTSTPYHLKTLFQYDSPVLWPTLLPESPALESTVLSNSEEEANSSAATGMDQDEGYDKPYLLAFAADSSTNLSWSSSMATPPSTDLKKNPHPHEGDKEKGVARALFSPNNSAEDSELGETSINITVEQEEASISLFAPEVSPHAPSPRSRGEDGVSPCLNCRAGKGGPSPRPSGLPCDCSRGCVLEIHCPDGVTQHKVSHYGMGQAPWVLLSQQVVPESQSSQTAEPPSSPTGPDEVFPGQQSTVQTRWNQEHWKSESPGLERNMNASCVRDSSQFNTSTPKPKSLSGVSHGETPPSRVPRGHRVSLRFSAKPRDLSSEFASPETSSVGRALADFFSSPETSPKQRQHVTPLKEKKIVTATSALGTCGGGEPRPPADIPRSKIREQMAVRGEVKESDFVSKNSANLAQRSRNTAEIQSDLEQAEPEFQTDFRNSSSGSVNVSDIGVNEEKTSADGVSNGAFDQTPKKARIESLSRLRTPENLSPVVPVTPPSILRGSRNRSQNSQSGKRVRFLEDCLDTLSDPPKRKRGKPNALVSDTDKKEEDVHTSQPVLVKDRGAVIENSIDVNKDETQENHSHKVSNKLPLPTSTVDKPLEAVEYQKAKIHAVEPVVDKSSRSELPNGTDITSAAATTVSQVPMVFSRDTVQGRIVSSDIQKHSVVSSVASLPKAEQQAAGLSRPSQPGELCADNATSSSSMTARSRGSTDGTETQKKETGIEGTVTPQDPRNVTTQICGEASKQYENSRTPQRSAQKPALRIGLRKTPRFLYPTSSQILKTCPQKVFAFSSASDGIGAGPQSAAKGEHHQGENGHAADPVMAETTVHSNTTPGMISPSVPPSTLTTTKPSSVVDADLNSGDVNIVKSMGTSSTETGQDNVSIPSVESMGVKSTRMYEGNFSMSSVLLGENENRIQEEPDWSDLEDFGVESCGIETKTKIDDQQMKENLPVDNNQPHKHDRSVVLRKQGTCESILHATDRVCTGDKSQLPLAQESKVKHISDVRSEPESLVPLHVVSPSPKPGEQNPKESSFLSGIDSTVALDSNVQKAFSASMSGAEDVQGKTDQPKDDHSHGQGKTSPGDDQIQEDLQNELLVGVDFSQELLSQSKSCFPPTVETGGTGKCSEDCYLPNCVDTNQLKDSGDIHHYDFETEVGLAASTCPLEKDAETFAITDESERCPDTVKTALTLKQNGNSQLWKRGSGLKSQKSSNSADMHMSKPECQRKSWSEDSSSQIPDACVGFRTAAGRLLQPTEKAMASVKDFFEKDMATLNDGGFDVGEEKVKAHEPEKMSQSDVHTKENDLHCETNLSSTSKQTQGKLSVCLSKQNDDDNWAAVSIVCGFKTASGKDFSVSSEYQKKAADMWQAVQKEMRSDRALDDSMDLGRADPACDKFIGSLSEKENRIHQLDKPPVTFDVNSELTNVSCQKMPLETCMIESNAGFKTAGGKVMNLSSKSQKKAVELWNSVEGELKSFDCLDDKSMSLNTGNSGFPLSKNFRKCVTGNGCGEASPKAWSAEKAAVCSKSIVLPAPARSVPQGYRPFKAPQVIKSVSEEERYMTKIPECPVVPQKNTILHHFTPVKETSKTSRGISEDSRGSKRKHSDEFSDDDDIWEVENMEEMLNSGLCQQRDQSDIKLPTSKQKRVSDPDITRNTSSDLGGGEASVGLEFPKSERSPDQTDGGKSSTSIENLNSEPVRVMHVENTGRLECGETDYNNVEEMSDAVMTDLSHDMDEVSESTASTSSKVPTEPCTTVPASSVSLKGSEVCVKDRQNVNLELPPHESTKPLAVGNVSFESLRCDENVSFDDEDFSVSHTDCGEGERAERDERHTLTQTDVMDLKELDFDSTIPDPTTDPAFKNHDVDQTAEDCDDDIQSSYVEKDGMDISDLENNLNSSHVEVSGGVVWTDNNHSSNGKDEGNFNTSVLSTPVHSLDAIHEEKQGWSLMETEDVSIIKLSHDMQNIDEVFAGDDFENDPVNSVIESKLSVDATERKTELGSELCGKAQFQNFSPWKKSRVLDGRESTGADKHSSSSMNGVFGKRNNKGEVESPEESLCNVSWSDITSTLNPSQWGDVKSCKADVETVDIRAQGFSQCIDACGDSNTHLPFTAYSKPRSSPETQKPRDNSHTSVSRISSKSCPVSDECGTSKEKASDADADRGHPCTDSEGFQVTTDLPQVFPAQTGQTVANHADARNYLSRNKPQPSLSLQGSTSDQFQNHSLPQIGLGFQTAAGKSVDVLVNSLNKVKHLFASEMGSSEDNASLAPLVFPQGQAVNFRTSAGHEAMFREDSAHKTDIAETKRVPEIKAKPEINEDHGHAHDQPLVIPGENVYTRTCSGNMDDKSDKLVCLGTGTDDVAKKLDENLRCGTRPDDLIEKLHPGEKVNLTKCKPHFDHSGSLGTESDKASQDGAGRKDLGLPQGRFSGFQTAGGAHVTVSKKALAHARSVLSAEDSQTDHVHEQRQASEQVQETAPSAEIHTPQGGTATISAKCSHLSESSSVQSFPVSGKKGASTCRDLQSGSGISHTGFQTASGGKVSVSAKSLLHARHMLSSSEDGNEADGRNEQTLDRVGHGISNTCGQFQGFETAGGKLISVSENALKNARTLDSGEMDKDLDLTGNAPVHYGSVKAFQSASKTLDSSETKTGISFKPDNQPENSAPKPGVCGFQTAGGKNVIVSRKALQYAQSILRDDDNSKLAQTQSDDPHPSTQPKFTFHTASRNTVSISDRALKHAHSLFQDHTDWQGMPGKSDSGSSTVRECSRSGSESVRRQGPSSPDNADLGVPAVGADEDALLHQNSRDCSVSSEQQGKGRKTKEELRPVVSDDSREMGQDREQSEVPPCSSAEKGERPRVAVKRTAVCADSEAILHDRLTKRLKLQPLTASERGCKQVPAPFTPPKPSAQSKRSTSNCSFTARPASTFQPPYKKPKISPPEAKHCVADGSASQRPKFTPPPVANSSDGMSNTLSPQPCLSSTVPTLSKGESQIEQAKKGSVDQGSCGLVTEEETPANEGQSETLTQKKCTEMSQSKSASEVVASEQGGGNERDQCEESTQISEQSKSSKTSRGRSVAVEEARMCQDKIIRQKKHQKIKPVQGRWLAQKSARNTMKFADLWESTDWHSRKELQHLGVSPAVYSVSSSNAEEFRFYLPSFYPGSCASVLVGDGALLVADLHGYAGKEEFFLGFLTVDGVDPGLVTEGWVYNHYRWIVWKLAAYEVTMPSSFAARALTPDVVMYQLKYRYDREVDRCHRSALKRIVERDDTPCKRLVLCISGIKTVEDSDLSMLEVTDGWYCLPCKPDSALQALIDRKKLVVGQKVVVSGAELAGSQESCSPLELCAGLHLKVSGNSTRRAGGGAKLGYQRDPTPLCVPLSSLHPLGGLVGCIDVVVVRKYPLMFMEKLAPGGCIFRTSEMEERARRQLEEQRQTVAEKLCSQLQAQMEKEEADTKRGCHKRCLKKEEVQCLTGAEISDAMDTVSHPEELQSLLSPSQMEELMAYRGRQREERQQCLNERLQEALKESSSESGRQVTPLQKFRIVGCCNHDLDSKTDAMLTVWRPGPDWENVQEGKRYRIYSLTASMPRCQTVGRSVELSAGRQTRLQALRIEENLLDLVYEPREVSCVSDLRRKTVPYGELDVVGVVISVKTALRGSDAVYAVDTKGDLLLIWFWGGLPAFSLQDTLTEGAPFAASSLRLKSSAREVVECSASLELSHFSAGGKTAAQRQLLQQLKQRDWNQQLLTNGRENLSRIRSSFRPTAAPATEMLEDLPPSFLDKLLSPLTQETSTDHTTPRTNISSNSSALDLPRTLTSKSLNSSTGLNVSFSKSLNSSTGLNVSFNASSVAMDQPPSPAAQEAERKRRVQREKLGRLAAYGRAPALPPLPQAMSPAANRAFKPLTPCEKGKL